MKTRPSWLRLTVPKIVNFFQQLRASIRAENFDLSEPIDAGFIARMFSRSDSDKQKLAKVIIDRVASDYQLKPGDLRGDSRKQSIVMARAAAIYLNRKLLGISFLKIGSLFGNRDHSTIMHAYRKIERIMKLGEDPTTEDASAFATANKIEKLERTLTTQFANEINFE